LYTRKEDKNNILLHLDDREEKLGKHYVAIHKDGEEIFRLIQVTY